MSQTEGFWVRQMKEAQSKGQPDPERLDNGTGAQAKQSGETRHR